MKRVVEDSWGKVEEVQNELCILGGALRGVGLVMSTLGTEGEDLSMSATHDEDMGYLVEALGKYAERLATDLDEAQIAHHNPNSPL